ncbi:MAG: hypothetical protein WD944_12585 [Steroidobacteraceae bacterium]
MSHDVLSGFHPAVAGRRGSRAFYPLLALAISGKVYWGFYYTYFGPVIGGQYPEVSPAIHVHGRSFFLWYVLFPLQAVLMATGRRRLHFTLGGVSVGMAAVMIFTGLLVASVRIDQGLSAPDPDEFTAFWKHFGLLIFYSLLVFAGFCAAAIANRDRPEFHKRLMIIASASALPAAVFRIIVGLSGFYRLQTPGWVMPAAFFLPCIFILIGILYDLAAFRSVHRVYRIGLPIVIGVYALGLGLAGTPTGEAVSRFVALFSDAFGFLY